LGPQAGVANLGVTAFWFGQSLGTGSVCPQMWQQSFCSWRWRVSETLQSGQPAT
jgi:hypothetical protein